MYVLMLGFRNSPNNIAMKFNESASVEAAMENIKQSKKESMSAPGCTVTVKDDIKQKLECFADDILWVMEGYEQPQMPMGRGALTQ